MDVNSLFLDFCDRAAPEMNGTVTYSKFNRMLRLAGLRLLGWLTGSIANEPGYPEPYTSLKIKNLLSPYLVTRKFQVENGIVEKPMDEFYMWERAAIIGSRKDELCGDPVIISGVDTDIELLDSAAFDYRANTHIKSLKPSGKKPICKEVGNEWHFLPVDLGSIAVEFKKYPIWGEIRTTIDPVYNVEIYDPVNSIQCEWQEGVRDALLFFLLEQVPVGTRESALQQQVQAVGKKATP